MCDGLPYQGKSYVEAKMESVEEEDQDKNLLDDYGFGIHIYFKLLWYLICLFGFFSFMGLGLMRFYQSH